MKKRTARERGRLVVAPIAERRRNLSYEFTLEQVAFLHETYVAGDAPQCPYCDVPVRATVPSDPRRPVSRWFACPRCTRHGRADIAELPRWEHVLEKLRKEGPPVAFRAKDHDSDRQGDGPRRLDFAFAR